MDIVHDDYQVHYDAATATVLCQGSFRLRGTEEYAPILHVLTTAADATTRDADAWICARCGFSTARGSIRWRNLSCTSVSTMPRRWC